MLIYKMSQIARQQYIGYIQQNLLKNHFIVILWSICETFIKKQWYFANILHSLDFVAY